MQNLWEEVSLKLEKRTKKTVSFLRSAALIWEGHFGRLEILKTTILKELDQVVAINNQLSEVYDNMFILKHNCNTYIHL